jgi:tRNA threonylcarbamoyladenosine biosynthesis protein TsaE
MTDSDRLKIESIDLPGLQRLANLMVRNLKTPLVIGLVGTLGAGKTSLVQAIARTAGIDAADVTSPTFTLLQTHQGSIRIHHLDAYRIVDEDEFLELGVQELFEDQEAWTLIEWADRVRDVLPSETLWINILIDDSDTRSIEFSSDESTIDAVQSIVTDHSFAGDKD